MAQFPALTRPNDKNMPGMCHIDVAHVNDFEAVPDVVDGNVPTSVTFKSGKGWSRIQLIPPGSRLTEGWELLNGDLVANLAARCVVAKDELAKLMKLWNLKSGRFIACFSGHNGDMLLCGNLDEPMQVRVSARDRGDEDSGDNSYLLDFMRSCNEPVPFYQGTPPSGVPVGCPTLGTLLAAEAWADIEALLTTDQLDDAEASICPVPVLCDVIDNALATGGDNVVVSGAGTTAANGTYLPNGTLNGKAAYLKDGGLEEVYWTGTQWRVATGSGIYNSTDNTTYPWQATTWNVGTGTLPVPTVAQSGASATVLLACLNSTQQGELLAELSEGVEIFREDASGTPSLHTTAPDGGSYTDARVAIRDSDDTTSLEHIAGGVTQYVLKRVRIKYTDASNVAQSMTKKITALVSSAYDTDWGTVGRIPVRKSDGTTVIGYTDIATLAYNVPDGVITKPDGTTVNLMANTALDVRGYRSGIVYKRGLDFWTGEATSYGTGSEGAHFSNGDYDYTPPVYPLSYAEMDRTVGANRWITLKANNTHGNTNRFTDETGAGTYTNNLVVDHLTGLMWYRVAASAATWSTALSNANSSSQGGYSDWRVPTRDELATIVNNEEMSDPLNYSPFNLAVDLWTNTTATNSTSNAMRCVGSSGFFNGLGKTSTAQYIMVRTHLG